MKSLAILILLTACDTETDKSLAKKIDAYEPDQSSVTNPMTSKTEVESEKETETDVKISRPNSAETQSEPVGCSDFAIDGDFEAKVSSLSDLVLSVKMNDVCDSASFRYVSGRLQVYMCSNDTEFLLADRTLKAKVTEIAIKRVDGYLKFEYRTNGKTELLEYLTIKGEFENAATVCLEKVE